MGQGAYIFGCQGTRLSSEEKAFFAHSRPWGFILFGRNVVDPQQLRALTDALRDTVQSEVPILIDQEGGRVQRLGAPHWREWLAPLEQVARAGAGAVRSMWLRYRLIADELRAVGIDANCAPVADVAHAETHPVLRNRCYSDDPRQVAIIARAVAEASMAGGVLPVIKHMPGHGRATADSHKDLPCVEVSREDLRASDFAPFAGMADLPLAMSAHVLYTGLDEGRAATVSPAAVAAMRDEIGFDGLLMSDDISMEALGGSLATRSGAALAAGCDVVLHCSGRLDEMAEVAAACGGLSAAARVRAERALAARRAPEPVDIAACEAELRSLLPEVADV